MKIFSWVHRKRNQKDGLFGGNAKKDEVIISNDENIGDHKQLVLQDEYSMLGGWKGGILTIGTFGFDPIIKDEIETGLNDVEECEIIAVSDHEEQNPMMYANHEETPIMPNHVITNNCPLAVADNDDYSNKGIKKERITLADLFLTDLSDDEEKVQLPELYNDVSNINKKSSKLPQVKNPLSFANKIIPRVRQDSRRIQKLMTRALKKKVHPDMESKNHKNSQAIIAAAAASTRLDLSPITTSKSISLREILETTA